jgi:hypothetical protein
MITVGAVAATSYRLTKIDVSDTPSSHIGRPCGGTKRPTVYVTKGLVGNDVSARLADRHLDPVGWYGDQRARDSAGAVSAIRKEPWKKGSS